MKKKTKSAKSKVGVKAKKRAKPAAKAVAKAKAKPKAKAKAKPRKAAPKKQPAKRTKRAGSPWLSFVEKHGVVLASAKGPVPTLAEAVAGEPIVGSWWAHPKGKEIFEALSEIDDSPDVRCFKLVDGKVTFVHRKAWPALVRLGTDGIIASEQLASVQQEHMPTGEHRNIVTPFPEWVDETTASSAAKLSTDQARAQLAFVEP